jgi:hypothetical protein
MQNLFVVAQVDNFTIKSVVGIIHTKIENAEINAKSLSEKLGEMYSVATIEENEDFYFVKTGDGTCFATTKNGALSEELSNGRGGYHNDFARYQNLPKGY